MASDSERILSKNTPLLVSEANRANEDSNFILGIAFSAITILGTKLYSSSLDEGALDEIRAMYQILKLVSLRVPSFDETTDSFGPNKTCFYESILKAELRFRMPQYIWETFQYLNLILSQLTQHKWGFLVGMGALWAKANDVGAHPTIAKFFYYYNSPYAQDRALEGR